MGGPGLSTSQEPALDPPPEPADDSIGAALLQAADDAKAYARAQIDLVRETAAARLRVARTGLILGAAAAALSFAALTTLVVGAAMALATLVGPLAATLIVVLVVLAIAALLGWLAFQRISDALEPIE